VGGGLGITPRLPGKLGVTPDLPCDSRVTSSLPGSFELGKIWLTLGLPYDYLQGRSGVGAKTSFLGERNAYKIEGHYRLNTVCIYRLKVYSIKFISRDYREKGGGVYKISGDTPTPNKFRPPPRLCRKISPGAVTFAHVLRG